MNVMLVDDYQLITDGLKKSFDWEEEGFPVVAQALNGKQALELLKDIPVDIIFTDIRMPVMNGIELIKIVTAEYPQIKIAVLSAYDDFEQVRAAFKLGADDYLLKQEVGADTIKNILEKFKGELLISQSRMELASNQQLRTKILRGKDEIADLPIENKNELRDVILKKLLFSESMHDAEIQKLGLNFPYDKLALMRFTIETADVLDNAEIFFFSLEHLLCDEIEQKFSCCLLNTNYNEYNLIYSYDGDNLHSIGNEIFVFLREKLSALTTTVLSAAVSGCGDSLNMLHNMLSQAKQALAYRFLYGKGKLLFFDDIEENEPIPIDAAGRLSDLKKCLHNKSLVDIFNKPSMILISAKETTMLDRQQISALFTRYIWIIIEFIEEQNIAIDCDKLLVTLQFLLSNGSLTELNEWVMEILAQISGLSESQNRHITQFKKYISMNYANSSLKIDDVAQNLGISVGHIGKLIYKETGCHFSDYLNLYRIECAKDMLINTTKKVYEIAYDTGYSNVEHFTRVFKKLVGITPLSYANK